MKLEIVGVRDKGIIARERLVLRASDTGDAGDFIILCAVANPDGLPISGSPRAAYWMPDVLVRKGDFIVLYTKTGTPSSKVGKSGRETYFYYIEHNETIWDKDTTAVVCNVSGHEFESNL
jgi:hypothetical protein